MAVEKPKPLKARFLIGSKLRFKLCNIEKSMCFKSLKLFEKLSRFYRFWIAPFGRGDLFKNAKANPFKGIDSEHSFFSIEPSFRQLPEPIEPGIFQRNESSGREEMSFFRLEGVPN